MLYIYSMISVQQVIETYQYVSRKIDDRPLWHFKPTDRQLSMLQSFVNRIHKEYGPHSVGVRFLTDYLCYQYLRWFEKHDTRFGKTVMLNWLIGPKAIERWIAKSEGWSYIVRQKITTPYKIVAENSLFDVNKSTDLHQYEEDIKERFRNDKNRIGHCVQNTTLFNRKSKWCITCNDRKECKSLLQKTYPSLYIQRGYAAKD